MLDIVDKVVLMLVSGLTRMSSDSYFYILEVEITKSMVYGRHLILPI